MRLPLPRTHRHWITLGAFGAAALLLILVGGFLRQRDAIEIDIRSGRVRYVRSLLSWEVGQRIEATWLSRALGRRSGVPKWHRVCTFWPGSEISPHYAFHGAVHQVETLEKIDASFLPFSSPARRKVARTVLALWQSGDADADDAANDYISEVCEVACGLMERGASIVRVEDLPDDPG